MRLKNCFAAGLLLLAPGCASQDIVVKKQAEMESRLEYLVQGNKALSAQVATLSNDVKELRDQLRDHSDTLRKLAGQTVKPGSEPNWNAGRGANAPAEKDSVTRIELINSDARAKGKPDTSSDAYMTAFGLYSANRYQEAIEAFTEFLNRYPEAEYAVNAQYWIGECYYSLSNLPKALKSFRTVAEKYPGGKKVPDAMLKSGYTLLAMKEPEKAKAVLESLVEKYPDSAAAARAREKLAAGR